MRSRRHIRACCVAPSDGPTRTAPSPRSSSPAHTGLARGCGAVVPPPSEPGGLGAPPWQPSKAAGSVESSLASVLGAKCRNELREGAALASLAAGCGRDCVMAPSVHGAVRSRSSTLRSAWPTSPASGSMMRRARSPRVALWGSLLSAPSSSAASRRSSLRGTLSGMPPTRCEVAGTSKRPTSPVPSIVMIPVVAKIATLMA